MQLSSVRVVGQPEASMPPVAGTRGSTFFFVCRAFFLTDLTAWGKGEKEALDSLMPIVYPELRRIARKHLARGFPAQTLESGAVVNEAYLKMIAGRGIRCEGRVQFFALCAQIIRHIVVDHARNRQSAKRGGAVRIPIDDAIVIAEVPRSSSRVGMTIGIDLGDVWSHYCTLNGVMEKWFTDLPRIRIAMEAGNALDLG